jgi:hypothetical protein
MSNKIGEAMVRKLARNIQEEERMKKCGERERQTEKKLERKNVFTQMVCFRSHQYGTGFPHNMNLPSPGNVQVRSNADLKFQI